MPYPRTRACPVCHCTVDQGRECFYRNTDWHKEKEANMAKKPTQTAPWLPQDSEARKKVPIATGVLDYFPRALAEIAFLSLLGNEKHNPGEPLHWSRGKSNDHPDCLARHFLERGTMDASWAPHKVRHSTEVAWRALAILEIELEEAAKE